MSEKQINKIAKLMLGLSLFLAATGLVFVFIGREATYSGWGFRGFSLLVSSPFSLTGILILNRLPKHGIGWVFLIMGFGASAQGLLTEYMLFSLILNPEYPAGLQVAWVLEWIWVYIIYMITLVLVLFPSGRPPSPHWRIYLWALASVMVAFAVVMALTPGTMNSSFGSLENPYGIETLRLPDEVKNAATGVLMLSAFGPPLGSLVGRFRRANGIERQQYKWFVYAAILNLVVSVFASTSGNNSTQLLFVLNILLFPIALAVAVLKYRLFDIDIIIRRTLSYAVLSALLAVVYFVAVVVLQGVFGGFSGNSNSPIITVISTLIIAALFNPLRLRIQDFIDQRFYRAKYDAEKTLEDFAQTTRNEVDISVLSNSILQVVGNTMQPDKIQLLLKTQDRFSDHSTNIELRTMWD